VNKIAKRHIKKLIERDAKMESNLKKRGLQLAPAWGDICVRDIKSGRIIMRENYGGVTKMDALEFCGVSPIVCSNGKLV